MNNVDLWPLMWEAWGALTAHYGPAIDHAAEELGIPLGEWYGWLMAARVFEPEPVSAQRLHVRSAYTSLARLEASLARGEHLGLLERADAGAAPKGDGSERRLTRAGRSGVQRLIEAAYAAMAPLRPLPEADLLRLAGLLQRLVEANLAAPESPGKWCLRIARHFDPGAGAPVMVRLDQYLSDLSAYRDDSHLAAWRPYGISGHAWEAFTLITRGTVGTLDELVAKLARRGYTREDYAIALQELVERGWISREGETYSVTERGRDLRQEAEAATNRYFFGAWDCLGEEEVNELRELLARFRDALNPAPA